MSTSTEIKKPKLEHDIHPIAAARWSTRAFDPKPIGPEVLARVFEAAKWSPSAFNFQPWRFLVGMQGDAVYTHLLESMSEFNRVWAKNAPVLVLALSNTLNAKGEPNAWHAYDTGQAVAWLSMQASAEGLLLHQMAGFDQAQAAEALSVPQPFAPLTLIAMGYLGDEAALDERIKNLEHTARERRQLAETVYAGQYGNPAPFV